MLTAAFFSAAALDGVTHSIVLVPLNFPPPSWLCHHIVIELYQGIPKPDPYCGKRKACREILYVFSLNKYDAAVMEEL